MKIYKKTIHDLLEKVLNGNAKNTTTATNKAYAMSNEYLNKFKEIYDVKDKRIATVGSSGDQVLNSIYEGCKDITLIDGNIYARVFTEYKMALIKTFNYGDFMQIFFEKHLFSPQVYAKISHYLSDEAKSFWDNLMLEVSDNMETFSEGVAHLYPDDIEHTITQGLIRHPRVGNCEFYYDPFDYKCLQTQLLKGDFKINYITADFEDFPNKLKGEYDVIQLSNIYSYVKPINHRKTLVKLFDNNLKKGGFIQVHYDLDRQLEDEKEKRFSYQIRGQKIQSKTLHNENNCYVDTMYYLQKPLDYEPQQLDLNL